MILFTLPVIAQIVSQMSTKSSQMINFEYQPKVAPALMGATYSNWKGTFGNNIPKYHGQFGHCLATRKISDSTFLLAVGAPWYQGVRIYAVKSFSPTEISYYLLNEYNELRAPGDSVGKILDGWQQNAGAQVSYNLFGFSIQFTGAHIIVGAPGDGDITQTISSAKFTGAIYVIPYRYDETVTVTNPGGNLFIGQMHPVMYAPWLNAANNVFIRFPTNTADVRNERGFDKFGCKIVVSTEPNQQWMAAVGNRAWDGSYALFTGTTPFTDATRLGVFIYYQPDPAFYGIYSASNQDIYVYKQFIPLLGKMPLSDLGFDIKFFGKSLQNLTLSVRDWEVNATNLTQSRGVVYWYKFNTITNLFDTVPYKKFNRDYNLYYQEDWYGYETFYTTDANDNVNTYISAPRNSTQVYGYENGNSFTIDNPGSNSRSFFGGKMASAQNNELFFVADGTSATGAGQVYMYQRFLDPLRYLTGYESVLVNQTAKFNLLGIFKAPSTTTSFLADHFGGDFVIENNILVVGAPAIGQVYFQPLPYLNTKRVNLDGNYTFDDNAKQTAMPVSNETATAAVIKFIQTQNGTIIPPKIIYVNVTQTAMEQPVQTENKQQFNILIFAGAIGALLLCNSN